MMIRYQKNERDVSHYLSVMVPMKHKKKRNVGITYELIIKEISSRLLHEDSKGASKLLKVLKKHFKRGSELHTELSCYKTLLEGHVLSQHLAAALIDDVMKGAAQINEAHLNTQIDALQRDLRHHTPEDFYEAHLPDYRDFASAYHLIRGARTAIGASLSEGLMKTVGYKDVIISRLTRAPETAPDLQLESTGTSRLIMSKMMSRLNEKYGSQLGPQQKKILREYAFSMARDDGGTALHEALTTVQSDLLSSIDTFLENHGVQLDEDSRNELKSVRSAVLNENLQQIDDETVTRFMKYVDLAVECRNETK